MASAGIFNAEDIVVAVQDQLFPFIPAAKLFVGSSRRQDRQPGHLA